ncbi:hypothetical protein O181_111472 [Austropuccinia psidii MF-1]|uniref:Retrovirus-related Pol polyprotein from transposon TNT 1-94-like beta-barrel domain-containing protein n=1 Tax=Austropuccinia psidii MF-1 TaxID=1389203 RepID=A0A9Q3K1V3_9BASI|nr:hypothetical protein [Austropuccinia psidii MF-1]
MTKLSLVENNEPLPFSKSTVQFELETSSTLNLKNIQPLSGILPKNFTNPNQFRIKPYTLEKYSQHNSLTIKSKTICCSSLKTRSTFAPIFSGFTISPEDLIDSVIAMWVIINLPKRFKTTMEVWLGECEVEKTSPSLDGTWEPTPTPSNTTKKREPEGDYPKCAPGWHNPLTRHDESECNFLKRDKSGKRGQKPIRSLIASTSKPNYNSIILDLEATTSMFNNPKIFTKISKLTQTIELADGSTILASGTGTVQIKLPHFFLELSDCLLVENLSYKLISLGQILKPIYKLTSYKNKAFQVLDQNNNLIIKGRFKCGNFEVDTENKLALTTVSYFKVCL